MYQNIDFETFVKSVSATTGFTADQVKTLLAYRDVKYLDETTAADLTAELNKLRDEMIKANPHGFKIKDPQTPLFPLEHISKVAGRFSLEEILLMVFIDCPNIKIMGENKIKPAVMGRRMSLAAGLHERGVMSFGRAFQLSGFMQPRDFYVYINERASERARHALRYAGADMKDKDGNFYYPSMQEPERIRKNVKGPITNYVLDFPNIKAQDKGPEYADPDIDFNLEEALKSMLRIGPLMEVCMSPLYEEQTKQLLEQDVNICTFTKMCYGETEAAKLGKFLILALSYKHFDEMLGRRIASGERALTLREIQFTAFLYFKYKGLEHEAFEPGLIQAHRRLINTIIAHAYECNIIKVEADKGHYRTAEGERVYTMLKAEEIPLKGKYEDLIDWSAMVEYRDFARRLTADEQALFMAVKCPEFITDPDKVINGKYRSFESQRVNAIVERRKLAVSMFKKTDMSREVAAKLAGLTWKTSGISLNLPGKGTKRESQERQARRAKRDKVHIQITLYNILLHQYTCDP
jgi:hypothetical protein